MTTVADLILQIREASDHVNSSFVTDPEIVRILNDAQQDVYNQIIRMNETYFVTSVALAINGETVALPNDVYKVNGIDLDNGNRTVSLRRFNFAERNKHKSSPAQFFGNLSSMRYTIVNRTIRFMPRPNAAYSGVLWYTPYMPALVLGGDCDFPIAQFSNYLTATATAAILGKEERSTSFWKGEAESAMKTILMCIPALDQGEPNQIVDIYGMNSGEF
jgi:hypothetical protein